MRSRFDPSRLWSSPPSFFRRRIGILIAIVAVTTSIAISTRTAAAAEKPVRPNIVFIMVDDLGYGDLGCYGQDEIQTPNIDRMASEGTRFTDCYAGSPVCAPSRSVLMTGLHTGHTRVRGNVGRGGVVGEAGRRGRIPLRPEDLTVAEVLKPRGYVTGMTGKWGLGEPRTTGLPREQGFDEFFGFLNQKKAHNHYPEELWKNGEKLTYPLNAGQGEGTYAHDLFTEFAIDFIERHRSEPFFLYLPYTVPHDRFQVPDLGEYATRNWTHQQKVYAAMISRMDRDVGRILETLNEHDLDETTLVFFCSDNGAANRYEGVFDSSGPLRGRKRDMTEGGIRTPMIVRWPGHVPAGRVNDAVWWFADLLPTLAALTGADVPKTLDGTNVLPLLLGKTDTLPERTLYWEFYERGFQQAARRGRWKAIRSSMKEPIAVYDLQTDIGETVNIADSHPEIVRQFERTLREEHTPSEEWPAPIDQPDR